MRRFVVISCFLALAVAGCSTGLGPEIIDAVDLPASAEEIPTEEGTQLIIDYSFPINELTVTDDTVYTVDPLVDPPGPYGVELPIDDDSCDKETAEDVIVGEPVLAQSKLSIIYTVGQVLPGDTDLLLCLKDIDYEIRGIDDPSDKMIKIKTEPDPDPPVPPDPSATAPTEAAINVVIEAANSNGMQEDGFNSFILPDFTFENTEGDPVYSITFVDTSLASVIEINSTDRTVSLATGVLELGSNAQTAIEYIYSVTVDEETFSSDTYVMNDIDGGGLIDYAEDLWSIVPLENPSSGWLWMDSVLESSFPTIPTGISTGVGLDVTDPDDDDGDNDLDGLSNIVEFNNNSNSTNPFVGTSTGTFGAKTDFIPTTVARLINLGDFNEDGNLDVALAGMSSDAISILIGDGNGSFAALPSTAIGDNLEELVTGDFNGDTHLDLVVTASGVPDALWFLAGVGDGTFVAGGSMATGTWPFSITTGNYNYGTDNFLDVAITNMGSGTISVYLGNGDGTFDAQVAYAVGAAPRGIISADLNDDDILDIATANYTDDNVSVLLGNADGTFDAAINYTGQLPNNMDGLWGLNAADMDNDGNIDLVAASYLPAGGGMVSVLFNDGDGTFDTSRDDYSIAPAKPFYPSLGDLDGDGDIDVVVTNNATSVIQVFLNDSGTLTVGPTYATGTGPWNPLLGDFNNDGILDVVTGNVTVVNLSILLGE